MPSLANLPPRNAGQPVTKAIYDQLEASHDYLVVAGADLASAQTIVPTNEFHKVTGTTTIRNIDHAAEVAGQQVRLWFAASLVIEHNGGGVGNIRLRAGVQRATRPDEIVTFVYDGAVWREQGRHWNTIAYVEFSAGVNVTPAGTPVDVVTSGSIVYDGQPVEVEFFTPHFDRNGNSADNLQLWDGATNLGYIYNSDTVNTVGGEIHTDAGVYACTVVTPSAGSHEYKIRAETNTPTAVVRAGPGGAGQRRPGWIRVSRFRD